TLARELARAERALRADWRRAGREPATLRHLLAGGGPVPADLPGPIRLGLRSVRELRAELGTALEEPGCRDAVDRALSQRARDLRSAVLLDREERAADAQRAAGEALLTNAARTGRSLTRAERDVLARAAEPPPRDAVPGLARPDAVLAALGTLRLREARAQLRGGLLRTAQMRAIARDALPALAAGHPVLLIGETGGAKTALAEDLARRAGGEPGFVSGYGDITAAQVIGSHELRVRDGVTVTAFEPGPLLLAMREGRPLILDEVNAMPPEFLKRLNRILQLRPGALFPVQEQAGMVVRIAPGFGIIATANEHAPNRYRGIEPLSAELVNRFGANTHRVRYPDADLGYADYPRENALIAAAALADDRGELPDDIAPELIERLARAAFVSQQVFAGNHGEGFDRYASTGAAFDAEPGLAESVIAPRTLVAILEQAALTGSAAAVERALANFLSGVMHREDRRVLGLILAGQGFGQ
ncbi:AAA family ATPase, partial [Leucobacter sp. M11]|uniref:AAA family ATPase n=1 Tax=Leucobacter sp. M11 TaxID=2993565 RepID=UPI002D809B45